MPALSARHWTRAEVLALPNDGNRYELVDGELLVSPTPRLTHQVVVRSLYRLIDAYVLEHNLGEPFELPGDLSLGAGLVVQPDIFVIRELPELPSGTWADVGVPILVVEVLSPSTARHDRIVKRRAYQRAGVATYWIVDTDAQLVEVWPPDAESPRIVTDELTWQPDPAVPPLRIGLGSLLGPT
jgi:Uma2 family endonuclease